jgi:hypothetical protein
LRAGGETVITRLADILVIQAIRAWIATDPQAQTGWLRALRDKQIGRAIALIHRDPARDWTVAFARRCRRHVTLGIRGAIHRARRRAGDALFIALEDARRAEVAQGKPTRRSVSSRANSVTSPKRRSVARSKAHGNFAGRARRQS